MYSGERLRSFRKHWSHTPSDITELLRFRNRMNEVLVSTWDGFSGSDEFREKFALISGTRYLSYDRKSYAFTDLYRLFQGQPDLNQIVESVQFILWAVEDYSPRHLAELCKSVNSALDASPGIPVRLVHQDGKATLYPLGAELLDEAVIDDNLVWLENYPDAVKPFQAALKNYSRKDPAQYRNLLDNLRLSVEQVLRAVLNNTKSLENQKDEFLKWLKARDAHSQIANIYHDLLFGKFAQYQNDAVKHHEDQYTLAEVEFVLYLTGTLLRFIQRADERKATVPASS